MEALKLIASSWQFFKDKSVLDLSSENLVLSKQIRAASSLPLSLFYSEE